MKNKTRGRPPNHYLIDTALKGNELKLYFGGLIEEITIETTVDPVFGDNSVVYPEFADCVIDAKIPLSWTIIDHDGSGKMFLFKCIDSNREREDVVFHMGDRENDVKQKLSDLEAETRVTHR